MTDKDGKTVEVGDRVHFYSMLRRYWMQGVVYAVRDYQGQGEAHVGDAPDMYDARILGWFSPERLILIEAAR